MTNHLRQTDNLAALLIGALKVSQSLAKDRDALEGGSGWRAGYISRLILDAKHGADFSGLSFEQEAAAYALIFEGIEMALAESGQNDSVGPDFDNG